MSKRDTPRPARFHFSDIEENLTEEEVEEIERKFPQAHTSVHLEEQVYPSWLRDRPQ